jgi:hypothetical protein
MASTSETGHPINVANFEDLISRCIGYGISYQPSKPVLQVPALQALRLTAQANLSAVNSAILVLINAINARKLAFDPLKPLATRIVSALDATNATDELVKDARTLNRKIQGKRKGETKPPTTTPTDPVPPVPPIPPTGTDPAPIPPTVPTPEQISVSQQSYDSLLENFNKLILLVASEPSYTPNEVDLQVATLTALAATLASQNTVVIDATTALSSARIARNHTLYDDNTGLYDIQLEVKKYVKSVFGASSEEYKQISKIKFTNYKP